MDADLDSLSIPELCALGVETITPDTIAFYPLTKHEGEAIRKHMTENYPDAKFYVSDAVIKRMRLYKREG